MVMAIMLRKAAHVAFLVGVCTAIHSASTDASIASGDKPITHQATTRTRTAGHKNNLRQNNAVRITTEGARDFEYLNAQDIYHELQMLATKYPDFVTLTSSQTAYGLSAAGSTLDCPFDQSVSGCANWILTIEDKTAHVNPATSSSDNRNQSWKELPEVFLSGCLHGNERIGPTAVTETAILLVEAAACEASMQPSSSLYNTTSNNTKKLGISDCVIDLWEKWGIEVNDKNTRQWLARLVSTRRIVAVPTANALGYYQNERRENGIDPNRDFPFDLDPNDPSQNYSKCMQTIAVSTVQFVFVVRLDSQFPSERQDAFQLLFFSSDRD
jgi:hypothetical protein